MSRLECIRARWIINEVAKLVEAQHDSWTAQRCEEIAKLNAELHALVRYH